MIKWKKVDKQGRPARRNCNSFEEHDYISNDELGFKIINESFGYDKEPWIFTVKGAEIHRFKRLKDAKAFAETYCMPNKDKDIVEYYEKRNLEQQQKIDELETQLLQYQTYVAESITAMQKNICKDFCPNIKPTKGGAV